MPGRILPAWNPGYYLPTVRTPAELPGFSLFEPAYGHQAERNKGSLPKAPKHSGLLGNYVSDAYSKN